MLALGWLRETDPGAGLELVGSLGKYWEMRGNFADRRSWLTDLLSRAPMRTTARARALALAAYLADGPVAESYAEEGLEIARELRDRRGIAQALLQLASAASAQGDRQRAYTLGDASISAWRDLGDPIGLGSALMGRSYEALLQSDYQLASVLLAESRMLLRQIGNAAGLARVAVHMARLARLRGENVNATALLEEGLGAARHAGNRLDVVWTLGLLGDLARRQGDITVARARLGEALTLACQLTTDVAEAICRHQVGLLALDQGARLAGVQLLGSAHRDKDPAPWIDLPDDLADYRAHVESARRAVGGDGFSLAWIEGAAMTDGEANAYAIQALKGQDEVARAKPRGSEAPRQTT
jgi:hypothetical protein